MKKFTLLFVAVVASVTLFAQGYNVTICGNLANSNGASATLSIDYWGWGNQGTATAVTDSLGDWCATFFVTPDTANYAYLDYILITQQNCFNPTGDTLSNLFISSDTTFTSNFNYCNAGGGNCSVSVYDSSGVALYAYANTGTAPFTYVWNTGMSGYYTPINGPGNYCVTMTDATGCSSTDCFNVTTSGSGCSVVIYPDSASNDIWAYAVNVVAPISYQWSTGETTGQITPPGAGSYCVTITDAQGCSSSACYTVAGGGNCGVTYTYYPDSLGTVVFTATGTGTAPFTYVWDFGDGNVGTGQTVTNAYNISGTNTFFACVTITDASGCSSTDCQYVVVTNPNQPTCDVLMSYYQDTTNNATVVLDAYPTGVAPFTYTWYFSDGTVTTTTTSTTTHTFVQGTGWDWACVEVIDANGCYSSYCDYIQISTVNTSYCYADFYATFDDVNGNPGEVFFWDWSTSNNNIVSWDWDLGNGQTSTLQNPVTTYSVAGYYTVCLTTTDANGCTDSYCQTCYIDPAWWANNPWNTGGGNCAANFVAMQDSTLPGMIYLIDLSVGSNLYYSWDFGNGVLINNQYPAVTFTNFGTYNVCLTITDTLSGCSDTYCDTLSIDSLGNLNKVTNWGISVIPTPMPQSATSVEEEMEATSSVSVYPNPTSREVNVMVSLSESEVVNVQMLDITGKVISTDQVIMNNGSNTFELGTDELPNGVYFVKVKSSQVNETERVIVQH